jgi:hypothetical protein
VVVEGKVSLVCVSWFCPKSRTINCSCTPIYNEFLQELKII